MSNTVVDPFGRFRFPRRRIGQTGFTLLEVLIVVGIIALLATILLTVVTKARDSGRRVSCLNNLQSIARAIIMYTSDNEGAFPMAAATMASNPMANRTPGHQYEDWVYWQSTQDPLNPPHLFIDSINSGGIGKYLSGLDDRSIGGLALLRCPSDARLANKGFLDFAPGQTSPPMPYPAGYPFSYSMNAMLTSGNFNVPMFPANAVAHSMKLVRDAGTKILVYEEDGRTIDDGSGLLVPTSDTTNFISIRHDGIDELLTDPNGSPPARDPIRETHSATVLTITNAGKMGNVAFCDGSASSISRMDAHLKAHWAPDPANAIYQNYP